MPVGAGFLTIVGDPVTFIVGDGVNVDYLQRLSLAGAIAILKITAISPLAIGKGDMANNTLSSESNHSPLSTNMCIMQ